MTTVSGILLAAGQSRRMGKINKLTLPVDGEPLLRRTARVLLQLRLRELVVVTGHEAESARAALDGLALRLVHNPHYREGQMTSVHQGLDALQVAGDAVLVCLADLPLLEPADLRQLVGAYRAGTTQVLVPVHRGRRGNPILIANCHREQILAGDRNLGCRRLIEKNPDLVTTVEMHNDHTVFDLDTPRAYCLLQTRRSCATPVYYPWH